MSAAIVDGGPWRGPTLREWLRRIADGAELVLRGAREGRRHA